MNRPWAGLGLRLFATMAFLLTGLASVSGAQMEREAWMVSGKERDYWGVVAQYAKGDWAGALAKIGAWTEKDLDSVLDSTEQLAKAASRCKGCEARHRFEDLPLRAAILLHAQRDRTDRILRIKERDGEPDCSVRAHGSASERLVKTVTAREGGNDFRRLFSLAMALDFRSMFCFVGAVRWAEFGLETAPKDADLLVARGLAAETLGATGYAEAQVVAYDFRGGSRFTTVGPGSVDKTHRLNEARDAFEKALASDPNQEEARMRLGRVLWRLGRNREAEESLRKAVNGKEKAIVYLGHLFLGQCLEDRKDVDGAINEYKAALSLRPDTQIGAVALAHALSLRGDVEGAREVLEPVLAFAGRRKEVDPFWIYLTGAPDLGEGLLAALFRESVR